MGIKLDIQPYCENCDEFEPDIEKSAIYIKALNARLCNTVIKCTHANRCRSITRYLAKEKDVNDQRSKWISVKDRLPEKRGLYLCYYKYEPDSPNVICENTYLGSGLWQSEMSKITHWMPIPEPPEEDKKDDI